MAGTAILRILLKADDAASAVFEKTGATGSRAGSLIRDNWKEATLALGGAALAVEALTRKQAEGEKQLARVAAVTGTSKDEMRDLALELSNVTFPLDEVTGLMELATQQGLRGSDQLAEYASFWDSVADATGLSSEELAKSGAALKAVGIDTENARDATAAFGFITQDTSSSVQEFLEFVGRAAPDLNSMGLSVDQTAALLGAMEGELGLAGRTARSEFTTAVSESDGTLDGLLETLGLTEEQFVAYQEKVADSSDVIARNAEIHAESFTPLQEMQHRLSELAFQYGEQIKMLSNFTPMIAALPAIIGGISKAGGLLSGGLNILKIAALGAWGALTSPVGLVVLAIAGVIAGVLLLIENWEKFSEVGKKAFEIVGAAIEFYINHTYQPAIAIIIKGINEVLKFLGQKTIPELQKLDLHAGEVFDSLTDAVIGFREAAHEKLDQIKDSVGGLMGKFDDMSEGIDSNVQAANDSLSAFDEKVEESEAVVDGFGDTVMQSSDDLVAFFDENEDGEISAAEWAKRIGDSAEAQLEADKLRLTGKAEEVVVAVGQVFSTFDPGGYTGAGVGSSVAAVRAALAEGPMYKYNPDTGKFDIPVGPGDPIWDYATGGGSGNETFGQPGGANGAGSSVSVTVNAPNFVGDKQDLKDTMVEAFEELQSEGRINGVTR